MSRAILQRHPGGHTLAMPSWTIVPMLYHAPPHYDFTRRTGRPVIKDDKSEDREYFQDDGYGIVWKIKSEERVEHNHVIKCVQKHALEGLSDMKSVEYFEAVTKFDKALSVLWPCHSNSTLERWIKTHRGHALLRAGLLECPNLHGKKTGELLQMSFETFSECVGPLRSELQNCAAATDSSDFNRSLLFTGFLGLAWNSFFRGNMEVAEGHITEAQSVHLEPKHMRSYVSPNQRKKFRSINARHSMRPPVDIDTILFQVALLRVIGTLNDIESLFSRLGNELSEYDEDCVLLALLEKELHDLKGRFEVSVSLSAEYSRPDSIDFESQYSKNTRAVVEFMDRLEAGYSGNTWLASGASQQAKVAYECAYASESVLLRAAALVGLGRVFMRLNTSSALVSEETGVRSFTDADKSKLEFAEAEMKYEEALEIYDELGFKEGQIIVQCNLGNRYHNRGQLQQALDRYTMAMTYFCEKMEKSSAAFHLQMKIAELHLDMENWEELAFNSIKKAAAIPTSINQSARAWVQHLSGSYYLKKATTMEGKEEQSMNDFFEAELHLQDTVKFLASSS